MTLDGHNKVIAAGFTLIRKRDVPEPGIWYKDAHTGEWSKMAQYKTKAARDRQFKELLKNEHIVED